MADHKQDDDLGRVIHEISRARAEADDNHGVPPPADDVSINGSGTKGEYHNLQCEIDGLADSNDGGPRVYRHRGLNHTQGGAEASPLVDPWVVALFAMGLLVLAVRLM